MTLRDAFLKHLFSLGVAPETTLVAVSGGPDSVALLDLLVQTGSSHGLDLVVAHADHGIHSDSAGIAGRVASLARALGLPVLVGRLELGAGASETAARQARYAWLEAERERLGAGSILTAHQADDQAETVLMRVLEGSGPAGLSGITARNGRILRPLLPFRRAELARYLHERGLSAWDDPANRNSRHRRSWIRGEVLPLLRTRDPEVDVRLLRVAEQASADRLAWVGLLDRLAELAWQEEPDGCSVATAPLTAWDRNLASALLMAAARRAGLVLGPSRARRVLEALGSSQRGARFDLGSGWFAEEAFGRFHLARRAAGAAEVAPLSLGGESGEVAWGRWRLRWRVDEAPQEHRRHGPTAWFVLGSLSVRGWRAGDRIHPLGGPGQRLLVRCFQEARVPRRRRQDWPVIITPERVVWLPGICRSGALVPPPGVPSMRVDAVLA
jgi:tRNA(Ile)-lysidine synthase